MTEDVKTETAPVLIDLELYFYTLLKYEERQQDPTVRFPRTLRPEPLKYVPTDLSKALPPNTYLGTYGSARFTNTEVVQLIGAFGSDPNYDVEISLNNKLNEPVYNRQKGEPALYCTTVRIFNLIQDGAHQKREECLTIKMTTGWKIVTVAIHHLPRTVEFDHSKLILKVSPEPIMNSLIQELLRDYVHYCMNGHVKVPLDAKFLLSLFFPKDEELTKMKSILRLNELIATFPGCIRLQFVNDTIKPFPGALYYLPEGADVSEQRIVSSIAFCLPHTSSIVNSGELQFIEVDASWWATNPYSFCILQGGRFNHTYPFGFIIYTIECEEMYKMAMKFVLEKACVPRENAEMQESLIPLFEKYENLQLEYEDFVTTVASARNCAVATVNAFDNMNSDKDGPEQQARQAVNNLEHATGLSNSLLETAQNIMNAQEFQILKDALDFNLKVARDSASGAVSAVTLIWLPVLSDMGQGIIAAFKYNPRHYFCHVHILRAFGTNANDLIFLSKLLSASKTRDRFLREREQIKQEIEALVADYPGDLHPFGPKYQRLLKMCDGLDDVDFRFNQWAIFCRIDDHVPKCSNHCESMHSHIKAFLKKYFVRSTKAERRIVTGILGIDHIINKHLVNLKITCQYNRGTRDKVARIEAARENFGYTSLPLTCNCGAKEYYYAIYGVHIRCCHERTANNWEEILPQIPPPIEYTLDDYQEFELVPISKDQFRKPRATRRNNNYKTTSFWKNLKRQPFWSNRSTKKIQTFLDVIKNTCSYTRVAPEHVFQYALAGLREFQPFDFDDIPSCIAFQSKIRSRIFEFLRLRPQLKAQNLPPPTEFQIPTFSTLSMKASILPPPSMLPTRPFDVFSDDEDDDVAYC